MFTCSYCPFQHPFEWALKEHMYVKHDVASDMKVSKFPRTPTKIYVGKHADRAPTKVSVPPIKRHGVQSGLGVEYETESEHGDTDEETVDEEQSVHESEQDEETVDNDETVDLEMDADVGDDDGEGDDDDGLGDDDDGVGNDDDEDTFHLLYLINDILCLNSEIF